MLLPYTNYKTVFPISGNLIFFKKNAEQSIPITLPSETSFRISLLVNPLDKIIKIDDVSPTLLNDFELENKAFYITLNPIDITEKCELTTDFGQAIYFYAANAKYGELSNFSAHGFEHDGLFYPTVEHFYQTHKFEDESYCNKIRKADTPKIAADLGKTRAIPIREDWERMKNKIMTLAVSLKFNLNDTARNVLINTEDELLIENSPYDNYWGIGRTGEGKNHLGTILMRERIKWVTSK